jgi:hypothetical protein
VSKLHEDMLREGPRKAPEPETAEQRTKRLGGVGAVGGLAAGGVAALAKLGFLGKFLFWVVAWHGIWLLGGWVALGAIVALLLIALAVHLRRET